MIRKFDAKIWKTGNANVITIPTSIIKRFKLRKGIVIEGIIKEPEK